MPLGPGNSQRIGPPTWVVMRLPGDKREGPPPANAAENSASKLPDLDENVGLLPPEGKSRAELNAELFEPPDLHDPYADPESSLAPRFTISDLLLLTTFAAVGMAGVRVLPPAPLAAFIGVITFFFFWLTSIYQVRGRWFRMAGWALATIYLIASAGAMVQSWWQGY